MKEIERILDTYNKIDFSKHNAALATVVTVEGSSYRRPGARMIMTDDGRWTGAISGGCLEGDALRKARQAILQGSPSLITYNTMDDKDAMSLGVGLGCNGIIDVLIEPIDHKDAVQIKFLQKICNNDKPAVLATVYESGLKRIPVGNRWLLENVETRLEEFNTGDNKGSQDFIKDLFADMKEAFSKRSSYNQEYELDESLIKVFIEFIRPSLHLIIFGGGYDAIPLLNLSKHMGWKVTVTDDCVAHIAPARFPQADALVHAPRNEVVQNLKINEYTAAVLLSHNYKYDYAVLKELLSTNIPYIGILGPRKKFEKMAQQLSDEGQPIDHARMENIHAPIGLDIGAELPEEIAVSIIAEIQAKFNKVSGIMLKFKEGPIHGRTHNNNHVASIF